MWRLPWQPARRAELVVLDDFFPNLLTGFRIAEFNAYLRAYRNVRVLSALRDFETEHARYAELYPEMASRVERYTRKALGRPQLVYLMFLNNAALFLPMLERRDIPFVLTLYPGGGFGLNEPPSDKKLRRVLASKQLRGLIVTQQVTGDYVRSFAQRHGLTLPRIRHIPGVVANPLYFSPDLPAHQPYFGEGKADFDVCFVAEKYMPLGQNKGYPEFVEAALMLREEPALRFHVVGSFGPDDIDVSALDDRITFHGRVETSRLPRFFAGMDLVVSPNKPYLLHPGNFDGFPTGGCVEAALCGVAVMASDSLGQNIGYPNGEAMLIIEPSAPAVAEGIRMLLASPEQVGQIARRGCELTRQWYAPSVQIEGRRDVISEVARDVALDLNAT